MTAASALKISEQRWKAWGVLLRRLHGDLRYTARPIAESFRSIDTQDLTALPWLSELTSVDGDVRCPVSVSREERAFARMFFAPLGTTDLEGQLEHIALSAKRAEEYEAAAKERGRRCSKAYAATGICAGLCLGLLFL